MNARPAVLWRPLIDEVLARVWPALPRGVDWIEAQVWQESAGNPRAVSPVGAQGLMQLMPATAAELGVTDAMDPRQNVLGGITYLRRQYAQLEEVPNITERLMWAFACYNGGRGYVDFNGGEVNTALELAKARAAAEGRTAWFNWDYGKADLARVVYRQRRPDWKQMVDYVDRIRERFRTIRQEALASS